jgi:HAD superfamily hydrolase (TIGR01662 family)
MVKGKIGAVGFDFDHTLGIDNKLERVAFLRMLDRVCEHGGRCIGTLADEIERIDALLVEQRAGRFTIEDAVQRFVRERGIGERESATWPDDYKKLCVDMVQAFVIPEPGVKSMLAELRERGLQVAILTNGWSPLQLHKAARVDFDGPVIVSSDVGVQKPERSAFEKLAQLLQADPDEIAFVGDTPATDVVGALRAGMRAIWFDADRIEYPKDAPEPSAVIHSLAELPRLV